MSSLPPVFGVPTFCLITGASRGLGQEMALSLGPLLGEGSLVVLTARSPSGLDATRKQLSDRVPGLTVRTVEADLGDGADCQRTIPILFHDLDASRYRHALLVHNAGSLGDMAYVRDLPDKLRSLAEYMTLNVGSCIALTSRFLRAFPEAYGRRRTLVAISSLCALQATKSLALYCSSKAARDMLMKTVAAEEPDLRVLNYAPGVLDTAMNRELATKAGDAELRQVMTGMRSSQYFLTSAQTCKTLIKVLEQDTFESGAHVDYWDIEQPQENSISNAT